MILTRLFEVRDQAERLRMDVEALLGEEQPAYRGKLQEQIDLLRAALDHSNVPQHFRIAVVGTFKTGKSSFVNKLAEERLAGVETNPETAAITLFRYADIPRAEVRLISAEAWSRMQELYNDAPQHPEVYRVAGLRAFNDEMAKRKDRAGHPIAYEPIDTEQLIAQWVKPGGCTHTLLTDRWETAAGKQAFRRAIRAFTSSRNPLHYFVQELVVYAPVPLLRDHVELIDTPGLNDTQLYRGQLTEELLSNVMGSSC